jgi:hypothetical protein
MAGIFQNGVWTCGFDFLGTSLTAGNVFDVVSAANSVSTSFAQFSLGKGIQTPANGYIGRSLNTNLQMGWGGFGYQVPNITSSAGQPQRLMTWYDTNAALAQLSLAILPQGQLQLYQVGGFGSGLGAVSTTIGSPSATGVIVPGSYCAIEWFYSVAASGGAITIIVNKNTVISVTGNTQKTVNAFFNQIVFGSENSASFLATFDNVYLLDGTGTSPLNTFLGAWRCDTAGPNADSATSGLNAWAFTTPQGTDWGNAANIPANAAQNNSTSTVGQRMSFRFPNINTSKVLALNTWYSVQGSGTVVQTYRSNSVDQASSPVAVPGSFGFLNQNSVIDPNTGQPWSSGSVASAQACESGLTLNS